MPKIRCSECANVCTIPTTENKCLDRSGGPFCCSAECAAKWIRAQERINITFDNKTVILNPNHECPDGCVYSDVLDMTFKSNFELHFAESMFDHGLRFWYEPMVFVFGGDEYTPDFFFYDHGALVEVKGAWQPGKRKKMKKFREYFSHIPLLVVPWANRECYFPTNEMEAT